MASKSAVALSVVLVIMATLLGSSSASPATAPPTAPATAQPPQSLLLPPGGLNNATSPTSRLPPPPPPGQHLLRGGAVPLATVRPNTGSCVFRGCGQNVVCTNGCSLITYAGHIEQGKTCASYYPGDMLCMAQYFSGPAAMFFFINPGLSQTDCSYVGTSIRRW